MGEEREPQAASEREARERIDLRSDGELRPITIETGVQRFCDGSALIRWGESHIICSASWAGESPPYAPEGWLSAEYAFLPGATPQRVRRERAGVKGRTAEIQRLIGRSLRAAVPPGLLDGRMIRIDCDVLQADGGTRCASITGAWVALAIALGSRWTELKPVAALSFGLDSGRLLTDLCYEEDAQVAVDLNVVLSKGGLVEVQGCAERGLFSAAQLAEALTRAEQAARQLFALQRGAVEAALQSPLYQSSMEAEPVEVIAAPEGERVQ